MEIQAKSPSLAGSASSPWMALHPRLTRNLRRVTGIPAGILAGGIAAVILARASHADNLFPQSVGLLVAIWIWLQSFVGPLFLTVLYADQDWVGERGLWKRRGMPTSHLLAIVFDSGHAALQGHPDKSARISATRDYFVPLRLRWTREQLGILAIFADRPSYGIWPAVGQANTLPRRDSDPAPIAVLRGQEAAEFFTGGNPDAV